MKKLFEKKNWYLIDATNLILGRLASKISSIIQGKYKSNFSKNKDLGDYVIVINCSKIIVTGKKETNKIYYKHSGYIGNLKKISYKNLFNKNCSYVLFKAIKGMIPKNKLSNSILKKIKLYKNSNHNHLAQNPKIIKI